MRRCEHGRAAVESSPSALPRPGEFDLPRFVDHVLTAGYAGPLSLEVFNDVFRQSAPVHTAVDALRSLLVLEESVARRSPPKTVAFGLTCPPPVPTLSGHAFVELSADAGSASEVACALTSFGFTKTGSHRSSNTRLWQQGDARILLNESSSVATGVTEITSLGIDSDSQQQLAARAAAFLAPASPRDGSGTAASAPDGTTLQFCDSAGQGTWTSQYDQIAEDVWAGTGLTRIDHVALTQPFDYFDEAALFYRAVLGLTPASDTEFAAPFGLVRRRAISDPSGRVRIALQRTLLRRGEWAPAVPEPQHVAFATADIFATARVMRDRGAPLLTVSNNYYEDLYARFALHPVSSTPCASSGFSTIERKAATSITSTHPCRVCACSSRWSSASARMGRTERRIRRSGWRRSVAKERTGARDQCRPSSVETHAYLATTLVTRISTHRLRGRWRPIHDGAQLAKPAAGEMIWSKSGTFRPSDPRAASQPRIAAGCVARLPRESRRLGKSAVGASAWPRHDGRPQLGRRLRRTVPAFPCGRARSAGPRSWRSPMAEIQPRKVRGPHRGLSRLA